MSVFEDQQINTNKPPFVLSNKWWFWIFILALILRAGTLLYNISLDIPPYWGYLPRTGLALALSDFGNVQLDGFAQKFHIGIKEALDYWYLNDRGLFYVYLLLDFLFEQVTYLHVQILNLILDAGMVFPVMMIAGTFCQHKDVLWAGAVYAVFVPQIQMAVSPDYNAWFTFWLLLLSLLSVRFLGAVEANRLKSAFVLLVGLIVTNAIANEFRSILALFSLGAAGWYWLVSTVQFRKIRLPSHVWKGAAGLALCGFLTIGIGASINLVVRGEASPVRSSFGHNFWTGIGQFQNPYGLKNDDGTVANWYTKETGRTDTGNTMGVHYNQWLTERAVKFISENPSLYASIVARRALRILIPNMAFTLIADLPSYTRMEGPANLIQMRKDTVAASGWLSTRTMTTLLREDPGYMVSLAFRVALMITMPIGLVAAFFFCSRRAAVAFACLPLAYIVICLSPMYATPPVVTSAYASVIPIIATGWAGLGTWIRRKFLSSGKVGA